MAKSSKLHNIKWKSIIYIYILAFLVFSLMAILPNWAERTSVKVSVQLTTTALLLFSLGLYVYFVDHDTMVLRRKTVVMFTTMLLFYAMLELAKLWEFGIYIVPFAFCSLMLSLIVSDKVAFFSNFVIVILVCMQHINWPTQEGVLTEEFFYLLFSGVIESVYASYVFVRSNSRWRYILVGLVQGAISAACCTLSYFMFQQQPDWSNFALKVGLSFASGILAVVFIFALVPLFERLFKVVSVFRYSEIASSDTALMRMLFEKAPGTYNHSLTVAIYVEASAVAIGLPGAMARAAAYYHDIGKIKAPSYFAENQFSGVNPHDSMTPEASVSMIKSHVVNGYALGKEHNLPEDVLNAILQHHGTMPIKYFYLKAQKYTDGVLPYEGYCYEGSKPTSKISAILMICDAAEAALRSVGDKSRSEKIVDDIVAERLAFDQFSDCDITMKEIDIVKSTIITTYNGIRHRRVKYPDVKLEI